MKIIKAEIIGLNDEGKYVLLGSEQFPKGEEAVRGTSYKLSRILWEAVPSIKNMPKGHEHEINIRLKFTMLANHIAPRRAPEVIKAEKEARCLQAEAENNAMLALAEKWKEEKLKGEAWARKRIMSQIDHAFSSGRHGSEPAAKYITCQCNAPADVLYLILPIPPGAAILDESTIISAVCSKHHYQYSAQQVTEIIACSRLEFFYDGVRQIAIKAAK